MTAQRHEGDSYRPEKLGHAVSIHGDVLTRFTGLDGIGEVAFDEDGCGPYHKIAGCPNCEKYAGEWWDGMTYVGALNAGRNPAEPCSRACRYQLEWRTELASRRLTETV